MPLIGKYMCAGIQNTSNMAELNWPNDEGRLQW